MSTISIKFYLDKKSKKPEKTIFAYIGGVNKKRFVKHTGYKIHPKDWDQKNQQPKRAVVDYSIIIAHLTYLKSKINDLNSQLFRRDIPISTELFERELDKIFKKEMVEDYCKKFYEAFDEFLKIKKNQLSVRTIQKYNSLLNHLTEFQKSFGEEISFINIDNRFKDHFNNFLIDVKKQTNNTIEKYFSCLKTFLKWAMDEDFHNNKQFTKFYFRKIQPPVVALTLEELVKLQNFDFSKNKKLERVRDIFLFACSTGQRYSDVANLKFSDIDKDSWQLRTIKTNSDIKVPISKLGAKILRKYQKQGKQFPVISNQKFNDYLKEACKKAGIDTITTSIKYQGAQRIEESHPKHELISSKTARKTFVTLSHQQGMSIEDIRFITGHKKYETTDAYLFNDFNHVKSEFARTWDKALR